MTALCSFFLLASLAWGFFWRHEARALDRRNLELIRLLWERDRS